MRHTSPWMRYVNFLFSLLRHVHLRYLGLLQSRTVVMVIFGTMHARAAWASRGARVYAKDDVVVGSHGRSTAVRFVSPVKTPAKLDARSLS